MFPLVLVAVLAAPVGETITVSRVLVGVRVTSYDSEPVTDLTPADFDVRIDGKPMIVESAEWIADGALASTSEDTESAFERPPQSRQNRGRMVVFFVQTGTMPGSGRVEGMMHLLLYAKDLVDTFGDQDRVAVFSFDSHLKLRLDFTSDRQAIEDALTASLWPDRPPPPPLVPATSLAERLDPAAMLEAGSSEHAMLLVAEALEAFTGPKIMLLVGWGLGELTPAGVRMKYPWVKTRSALERAKVTIIALDSTFADSHSLEAGLQIAADETGGFYAKTHQFAPLAIRQVQGALAGHYELELRSPGPLREGARPLTVRVKRRGVRVMAPSITPPL